MHLKLAHNSVTKAISSLKRRFPSLSSTLEVEGPNVKLPTYFAAYVVLYNICLDKNDLPDDPLFEATQEFNSAQLKTSSTASAAALQKRDLLCKQLELSEKEGVCFV